MVKSLPERQKLVTGIGDAYTLAATQPIKSPCESSAKVAILALRLLYGASSAISLMSNEVKPFLLVRGPVSVCVCRVSSDHFPFAVVRPPFDVLSKACLP